MSYNAASHAILETMAWTNALAVLEVELGKVYPTGHQDMPRGTMDIDVEFIIVYPNLMSDDSILFFAQILEIPTVSWLLGIKNSYSQPENMG